MKITEYEFEDNIICPFCDEVVRDEWEFIGDNEDGYLECYNCGRTFLYNVHRSVSYSSYPLDLEYYIRVINKDISLYYWQFGQRDFKSIDDIKKQIIMYGCDRILQNSFTKFGLNLEDIELGPDPDASRCGELTESGIKKVEIFHSEYIIKGDDEEEEDSTEKNNDGEEE